MILQSSKLLLLYDFNRFKPALYGQPFFFWSKLQRFPYMEGVSYFWGVGASFNTIFFFSHLFRVFPPNNLSPYQGTLFPLSDFLRYAVCDVNPVNNFFRQTVSIKGELVPLELFSQTSTFIVIASCYMKSPFLKWKKMIDSSSHGWFFLFWTFLIWYKVLSNTCYIFSPLFLFHCFSQVATNFTFISETFFILLLLKCLPSNARKKSLVKIKEHKLEEAFSDSIRDVQLGRFIYSVSQFLNNFPHLPSFPSLVFSIDRWKMTALFVDNSQWFWTLNRSGRLEVILWQVTIYRAPFMQFSP